MQTGEVVQIGQHRLCCGDAGNPEHVAALFDGAKPDLVFTSPPYLQQRAYDRAIDCWDTMMQSVFGAMPWHDTTQVLVNLGMVHRKGEWLPYWDNWIEWMRAQGWKRFAVYCWDKQEAMPGDHNGRLAPSFEWVFHFNKMARYPNKIVPCKRAGETWRRGVHRCGNQMDARQGTSAVQPFKIQNAVIRVAPEKGSARHLGHPAIFPVALPVEIITAYTDAGQRIYDPFCGSGTSILAAHQIGRIAYGMEISPEYCNIAVERIRKAMAQPRQGALAL